MGGDHARIGIVLKAYRCFSHNNLALTFPTNTELLGCLEGYLEGSRELKIFSSSLQRIHSLD